MTYLVLGLSIFCAYILGLTGFNRLRAGRTIFGLGCLISASIFVYMSVGIATYLAASLMVRLVSIAVAISIGTAVILAVKRKFPETT